MSKHEGSKQQKAEVRPSIANSQSGYTTSVLPVSGSGQCSAKSNNLEVELWFNALGDAIQHQRGDEGHIHPCTAADHQPMQGAADCRALSLSKQGRRSWAPPKSAYRGRHTSIAFSSDVKVMAQEVGVLLEPLQDGFIGILRGLEIVGVVVGRIGRVAQANPCRAVYVPACMQCLFSQLSL